MTDRFTTATQYQSEDDVQGYVVPLVIAGALAFGYGMMAGAALTTAYLNSQETGTLKGWPKH